MSQVLTDGNDTQVVGTTGELNVYALDGNDRVYGGNTNSGNFWYGGNGNDALLYQRDGWIQAYGGAGNDTIHGGSAGTDWLYGDDGNDLIVSGEFSWATAVNSQTITLLDPTSGGDSLFGGQGTDALYGFDGDDILYGGEGDDSNTTISVASALTANETMTIMAGLYGGDGADYLDGGRGNDYLDGGTGVDTMLGGEGNDTFIVDNASDIVREAVGAGTDSVQTSVTYALGSFQEIESLSTTNAAGASAINLTGNDFGQTITGNAGANVIVGLGGADTMIGLGGNDVYSVDDAGDIVDESAIGSGGVDRVQSGIVSINLSDGAHFLGAIENAGLTGSANLSLTGNAIGNVLTGNAGSNIIAGGLGNDKLIGGAGNDYFVFDTTPNSASNVDVISDFSVPNDTIRLDDAVFAALTPGVLAVSAFVIGPAAANAAQKIIYTWGNGWLSYDADGSGPGAAVHFATIAPHTALTNADFVVI